MSDASSYPYLDVETLESLRETQRKNLAFLSKQASNFAAGHLPMHLQHQIDHAKAQLDAINAELARRGIASTDPPPSTPREQVINYYISGDYAEGNIDKRSISAQGDYAEGNIDKRSADITVDGGTVAGNITGYNDGTVTSASAAPAAVAPAADVLRRIQVALRHAQTALNDVQQGDEEASENWQLVLLQLKAAVRAHEKGEPSVYQTKLANVRAALDELNDDAAETVRLLLQGA